MIDAIIGAVGDIAGSVLGNQFNKREAKKQRDWQEDMSATAHQRQVADMRAAGLNPILSVTGGSGATTPGGATAHSQDLSSIGTRAANSARASKELKETLDNIKANTLAARNQATLNGVNAVKASHEVANLAEINQQSSMKTLLMQAQLPYQLEKAKLTEDSKEMLKYERFLEPLYKIFGTGNSARSLFE